MRVEKRVLNDALRVLGKVVCQTSPVELYRSVRFVGDETGVLAMATDSVETVSMKLDAFTDGTVDFCLPFNHVPFVCEAFFAAGKGLVRVAISRNRWYIMKT